MSGKKLMDYQFTILFSGELVDVNLWIEKAEELLAAARFLESPVKAWWSKVRIEHGQLVAPHMRENVQAQYFMLMAYAIENYFKALLIQRNYESLRNKLHSRIPEYIKEHDLVKLAREVNFELTVDEEELLSRLSRNSIWAARYPVPARSTGICSIHQLSNGKAYFTAYFGPGDVNRVNQFLDRLRAQVSSEIGKTS